MFLSELTVGIVLRIQSVECILSLNQRWNRTIQAIYVIKLSRLVLDTAPALHLYVSQL